MWLFWMFRCPGKSGFEVLRELRSEPRTAEVPVLMLSGLGGGQDRVKGLREGADDYLAKPFEIEELRLRNRATCFHQTQNGSSQHGSRA